MNQTEKKMTQDELSKSASLIATYVKNNTMYDGFIAASLKTVKGDNGGDIQLVMLTVTGGGQSYDLFYKMIAGCSLLESFGHWGNKQNGIQKHLAGKWNQASN